MKEELVHLDWWLDDINIATVYKLSDITDGNSTVLPSNFILSSTLPQNQRIAKYTNGCTCFALSHCVNEQTMSEKTTWDALWTIAVEERTGNPTSWWSMSLALRLWIDKLYINWYANIEWIMNIKLRLFNRNPIYTGSNKIDWQQMARDKSKFAVIKSGNWHIFAIVGWNDNLTSPTGKKWAFIVRDSMWKDFWYGDGHFYVSYEDIESLYTTISLITKEELENLQKTQDERAIQAAIASWITNGKNLYDTATRWQVALMVWRLKYWVQPDEELLYQTIQDKIWNGNNEDDTIIREHMLLMFGRLLWYTWTDGGIIELMVKNWYTNWKNLTSNVTREQVVIMAWRVLLSNQVKNGK